MTVQHGAIRAQAQLVSDARGFNPFVTVDFVIADNAAHAFVEDFGATAGKGIHAGIAQTLQGLADETLVRRAGEGVSPPGEALRGTGGEGCLRPPGNSAKPTRGRSGG